MKILIAGASGFVGRALSEHLTETGHEVAILARRAPESETTGALVWNPAAGELSFPDGTNFDAVIHLGGANIADGRWTQRRKAELRDSRIQSAHLLAKAISKLPRPPGVFACASAIGIYGDRGIEVLDENTPAADTFMGLLCKDWENACDPAREAGIRVLNLRFGIALAPTGGALAKMLPAFRFGLGGKIGDGSQYWSWISLPDLLRAIVFCLEQPNLQGPVNLVSPCPVTNLEFTRELGNALNRPTILPLPRLVARLALGEMADAALLCSARVIPRKLTDSGFSFAHSRLDSALSALR
ncbi:MAG: TIGR01777 family protein [Verrucomicrobiae bacterium]|nr:TIGR01777 family protein [Verrucomicrobiae bacterium]